MKKFPLHAIAALILLSATTLFAQTLSVFDVDPSSFPDVKAKFYAFDEDLQQITNLSIPDFDITEDGKDRTVTLVSCPPPGEPEQLSAVLTIDRSGSMGWGNNPRINLAKEAAKAWVTALPLSSSECAITNFNHESALSQDFTQDSLRLYERIDQLEPEGGTDYDEAFLDASTGGINIAADGQYNKVLIFLTDGMPNNPPDVNGIISAANSNAITIYCVSLDMRMPQSLKNISESTGGDWFENVTTVEQAKEVYLKILLQELGIEPCELEWESEVLCDNNISAEIEVPSRGLATTVTYTAPKATSITRLEILPEGIRMGGVNPGSTKDENVLIIARNRDIDINSITSDNPRFAITDWDGSEPPFTLAENDSRNLTVTFTPTDSGYALAKFSIDKQQCENDFFYVSGGFSGRPSGNQTLRLTHPNGGEQFLVCDSTTITWEGILPEDTVSVEISFDNGETWYLVTDTAHGLNLPIPVIPYWPSDQCLAKVVYDRFTNIEANWIRQISGDDGDRAIAVANDISGNTYIAGRFTNSADLGNNKTVDSDGGEDVFIAKYDADGVCQWAESAGGSGDETVYGIAVDDIGNVIIVGAFSSSMTLGSEYIESEGAADAYVAKLSSGGNFSWAHNAGGISDDNATGVGTDMSGNIYVCGWFSETAEFSGSIDLTSQGDEDGFIAKYNTDGDCQWAKKMSGSSSQKALAMNMDFEGNPYVTGFIKGSVGFGNNKNLNSTGGEDVFFAKYDSNGDCQLVGSAGGMNDDEGRSISVDDKGNIALTGFYSGNANFGNGNSLSPLGGDDAFVAKYNSSGVCQWARRGGGTDKDRGLGIATDYIGNVFFSGYFEGQATFCGSLEAESHGLKDAFIVKYDEDGNCEWLYHTGGESGDIIGHEVSADDMGNIYIAGEAFDDLFLLQIDYGQIQQIDESDDVWSIELPQVEAMNVDFGQVLVGDLRDSIVTAHITNDSPRNISVFAMRLSGSDVSDFNVVSGLPPFDIAAGGSKDVEFLFTPSSIGLKTADLEIFIPCDTIECQLTGTGIAPRLVITTELLDFGKVMLGRDKDSIEIMIHNIGSAPIDITDTELLGPDNAQFSIQDGGGAFTLQPGTERQMTLRFSPTELGKTNTFIGFHYDGLGSPARAQLFGEGIEESEPELTTVAVVTFSKLICEGNQDTIITVKNTGTSMLTIFNARITGADANDFELINASTIEVNLQPGEEAEYEISFNPKSAGAKQAELEFTTNLPEKSKVPLSGEKEIVSFEISPSSIDFGTIEPNTEVSDNVEITNTGTVPIEWISPVTIDQYFSIDDITPLITPAGGTSQAVIKFAGAGQGDYTANYDFVDQCEGSETLDINVEVNPNPVEQGEGYSFYLSQSVPNPSSRKTVIEFGIARQGEALLELYDIFGTKTATIFDRFAAPGVYRIELNTSALPVGTYFYILRSGEKCAFRRMEVVR